MHYTLLAYQFPHLLVRYGIACLRLFVVVLQDLHCLHRSYHNHWCIILTSISISTFSGALLVRYGIACLRLYVVILHCLHRSYHNADHWGIKLYGHTNFASGALFVRYSNACLRLFCTRFT